MKKYSPLRRAIVRIFSTQEPKEDKKCHKIKKNAYISFADPKLHET
jgi:hypothetical protein